MTTRPVGSHSLRFNDGLMNVVFSFNEHDTLTVSITGGRPPTFIDTSVFLTREQAKKLEKWLMGRLDRRLKENHDNAERLTL